MNNNFYELSSEEMQIVDGGSAKQAAAVGVGTTMVAWAPVAAFIPGVGWAACGALALTGASLIGKGTGCY
jgi:hypothetical protein